MIPGHEDQYSEAALERSRALLDDALHELSLELQSAGIVTHYNDGRLVFITKGGKYLASVHHRDGFLSFCDEVASAWDGRARSFPIQATRVAESLRIGLKHAAWALSVDEGSAGSASPPPFGSPPPYAEPAKAKTDSKENLRYA